MPILSALESRAWSLEELEAKFPMAEQIIHGLISDGFVEQVQSADASTMSTADLPMFALTESGRSFVKKQAYY